MKKRSADEILKEVEQAPLDDAMERVLAMKPEERRRELEEAGVDMAALHAKADAFYERMKAAATNGEKRTLEGAEGAAGRGEGAWARTASRFRSWRVRWVAMGAAAATAAAGTLIGVQNMTSPTGVVGAPNNATAQQVRAQALEACDEKQWRECLAGLDVAKLSDPVGDEDARVQTARKEARAALAREGEGGSFN